VTGYVVQSKADDRLFARSECGGGGSTIAAWEQPALTDRVIPAQAGIQTG
jgi:hypothetical protein